MTQTGDSFIINVDESQIFFPKKGIDHLIEHYCFGEDFSFFSECYFGSSGVTMDHCDFYFFASKEAMLRQFFHRYGAIQDYDWDSHYRYWSENIRENFNYPYENYQNEMISCRFEKFMRYGLGLMAMYVIKHNLPRDTIFVSDDDKRFYSYIINYLLQRRS